MNDTRYGQVFHVHLFFIISNLW